MVYDQHWQRSALKRHWHLHAVSLVGGVRGVAESKRRREGGDQRADEQVGTKEMIDTAQAAYMPSLWSGGERADPKIAPDEIVILLHPPSAFSRCINSDEERTSAE